MDRPPSLPAAWLLDAVLPGPPAPAPAPSPPAPAPAPGAAAPDEEQPSTVPAALDDWVMAPLRQRR